MVFKKIQTMALMILVVGLLVLVSTSKPCAQTPYTGSIGPLNPDDPGEVFFTGQDNIMHIRDAVYSGFTDDALNGTFTFFINGESNEFVLAGIGTVHGSFLFEGDAGSLSGTFAGRLAGKVTGGNLSAVFVGSKGTGDFAGMHIKGTLEGPILEPLYVAEIR